MGILLKNKIFTICIFCLNLYICNNSNKNRKNATKQKYLFYKRLQMTLQNIKKDIPGFPATNTPVCSSSIREQICLFTGCR